MGVEPTAARSARPATGFEDRGAHRDPTTPNFKDTPARAIRQTLLSRRDCPIKGRFQQYPFDFGEGFLFAILRPGAVSSRRQQKQTGAAG